MFVDVDVELAPGAAAAAAGLLLGRERLGLVSGFPRQIAIGVAERLVVPWIHVLLLGYLPMDRMRRSSHRRTAPRAASGSWRAATPITRSVAMAPHRCRATTGRACRVPFAGPAG